MHIRLASRRTPNLGHDILALNYFPEIGGPHGMDYTFIHSNQVAVQMILRTHQDEMLEIVNLIIKSGKVSRERMLDWFALALNKNHKRRGDFVDPRTVATDGFMINITCILDRLCEPFMDSTFSKVDRIDVQYLRRNPRVEITDETKIDADQKTADEFYGQKAPGTNNFISEVFFLAVASHYYGTGASNKRAERLEKEIKQFEKEVEKVKAARPASTGVSFCDE